MDDTQYVEKLGQEAISPKSRGKLLRSLASGKDSRIGTFMAVIILFVALFADLLTAIPIVGSVVDLMYWVAMSLYLYMIGCGFLNAKRLATTLVAFVIEFIPGIQWLPAIFFGTALIIVFVRLEDRTKKPLMSAFAKRKNYPLNQDGVRLPPSQSPSPEVNNSRKANLRPLNVDGVRSPS